MQQENMNLIGKLQPVILIFAALLGLALGVLTPFGMISLSLIEPFLMLLLYVLFLTVDISKLRNSLTNRRYTWTAVFLNFAVTPALAYWLGLVFLGDSVDIRVGLLMLLVTPCTDWYLVFTGLGKGNVELNLSILPLNLVLQIVLFPVYLLAFMHSEITMNIVQLLLSICYVLLIPFVAATLTKMIPAYKKHLSHLLEKQCDNLQLFFLCAAVISMFASEGQNLMDNPMLLAKMFAPLICFFIIIFFTAQGIGRLEHFSREDIVALNFTTLARNSPLSLAIAAATFSDRPLILLTLVIGSLIELPVLSITAAILVRCRHSEDGRIVACGTPEEIKKSEKSVTGRYL